MDDFAKGIWGKKRINIDSTLLASLQGIRVSYNNRFARMFEDIGKNAVTQNLKDQAYEVLSMLPRAIELLDIITGARGGIPTDSEIEEATEIVQHIDKGIKNVFGMIDTDMNIKHVLRQAIHNFDEQEKIVKSTSHVVASRMRAQEYTEGGVGGAYERIAKSTSPVRAGIGGAFEGARTHFGTTGGGAAATFAAQAILGPYAPLLSFAATGIMSGRAAYQEAMKGRRDRDISPMAAYKELSGVGYREYGGERGTPGIRGGAMEAGKFERMFDVTSPLAGKTGAGEGAKVPHWQNTKAWMSAMSLFWNGPAYQTKYLKRLLATMEDIAENTSKAGTSSGTKGGNLLEDLIGVGIAEELLPVVAPIIAGIAGVGIFGMAAYAAIKAANKVGVDMQPQMANVMDPMSAVGSWGSALGGKWGKSTMAGLTRKSATTGSGIGLSPDVIAAGQVASIGSIIPAALQPMILAMQKIVEGIRPAMAPAGMGSPVPYESGDAINEEINKGGVYKEF